MEAVVTRETHFDYQDFLNKLVHIFFIKCFRALFWMPPKLFLLTLFFLKVGKS